jgi:hypothetical protein
MLNAQGSRVIIIVVQVGPVKLYVAAVQCSAGAQEKGNKRRMKLSLPPKLLAKKN